MASITGEIEIDVVCTECGNSLDVYERTGIRGVHELHIELCNSCLKKREDQISALEDQLTEQSESYETEIERLKEIIEALEVEIIFNKITNVTI